MNRTTLSRKDRIRIELDDELDGYLGHEAGKQRVAGFFADLNRTDSMIELLESTLSLPGDVIECGVFRGISLRRIGLVLAERAPRKFLYGLDSFEGFPRDRIGRVDLGFLRFMPSVAKKFQVCNDTPNRLKKFFDCYGVQAKTVKGYFHDTLQQFAAHQFCFVHLDCDIYQSYKDCLNVLYDRLVPGGVIVFDDYRSPKWPGAEKAVDEFFFDRPEKVECCTARSELSWYIRKSACKSQAA